MSGGAGTSIVSSAYRLLLVIAKGKVVWRCGMIPRTSRSARSPSISALSGKTRRTGCAISSSTRSGRSDNWSDNRWSLLRLAKTRQLHHDVGRRQADRGDRHDLPPAPPPPEHYGAGTGPAYSDAVNTDQDVHEHPGSALERQLGGAA